MRRYLLDEHIPPIYRTQLLYHEPSLTVLIVSDEDAPARSTPDPEILHWCERYDFNLITIGKVCPTNTPLKNPISPQRTMITTMRRGSFSVGVEFSIGG